MKKPSLDRIDASRHYCVHNTRFIEFWLNSRLPHEAAEALPAWVTEAAYA